MTLNITPGPLLFTERPEVVWGLIATLLIANVMLLILNVPLVKFWDGLETTLKWWELKEDDL